MSVFDEKWIVIIEIGDIKIDNIDINMINRLVLENKVIYNR